MYQDKYITEIEKKAQWRLRKYLTGLLITSIHFDEAKTKSVIFTSKQRAKNIGKVNIRHREINKKQQKHVTYLRFLLDESMSGEPVALKVVTKIKLK